jgi:hypothetical protein
MIVIPPCSEYLEYFTGLAENIWENSLTDKNAVCQELLSENRTLLVTCVVDLEESHEITFHLHFRYFNAKLYCFIQED